MKHYQFGYYTLGHEMSRESATVQKITQEPKRKNTRVFKRCFGTNEIVIFRIKVLKSSSAYYIIVKLYKRTFSSVGQSHRLITGLSGVQVPEGPLFCLGLSAQRLLLSSIIAQVLDFTKQRCRACWLNSDFTQAFVFVKSSGSVVKRLRHRPFTAVTRVRFPSESA